MLNIVRAETDHHFQQARALFEEYAASLDIYLSFQHFDRELTSLLSQYSPPDGRLLLAYSEEQPAGCVGLRRLDGDICEMKRLYVKPPFRSSKVGRLLAERIIEEARRLGYKQMRLDTLAAMVPAQALYRSLGFSEIAPYYDSPVEGTVFMELRLQHRGR